MTIEQWLVAATDTVVADDPAVVAEILLAERLGKNRAFVSAFPETVISKSQQTQLSQDLTRLAGGYPLAYLLGKKSFWDMELHVSEATLIPRADTETLIEVAQMLFPADTTANIVDLGTGSGAIAIALSRVFAQSTVTATDISKSVLDIAQLNAANWQIAPIYFKQTEWLAGFADNAFDLIASNPPYIAENDGHLSALKYEPLTALTAEKNGLADIETIILQAQTALTSSGWLLLEHGYDQGQAVRDLLTNSYWQAIKTHRDLGGNERITAAQRAPK